MDCDQPCNAPGLGGAWRVIRVFRGDILTGMDRENVANGATLGQRPRCDVSKDFQSDRGFDSALPVLRQRRITLCTGGRCIRATRSYNGSAQRADTALVSPGWDLPDRTDCEGRRFQPDHTRSGILEKSDALGTRPKASACLRYRQAA